MTGEPATGGDRCRRADTVCQEPSVRERHIVQLYDVLQA